MGDVLHAHPVRGKLHIQQNANREIATRAVESEVPSSDSDSGQFRLSDSNSDSDSGSDLQLTPTPTPAPTFSCISYLK